MYTYQIPINHHFPNAKLAERALIAEYYITKQRSCHQIVNFNLPHYDRKCHKFSNDALYQNLQVHANEHTIMLFPKVYNLIAFYQRIVEL